MKRNAWREQWSENSQNKVDQKSTESLKSSTLSPDDDENVESVGHEDKLRRKEAVQELFLQVL